MENQILVQTQELYTKPSKDNVEALTNAIIAAVDAHPETALLALAQLTGWSKAIDAAIKDVRLTALKQVAGAPVKSFTDKDTGVEYQIKKPSVKKNFAFYFDENNQKVINEDWLAKKAELDNVAAELKGIEATLDALKHYEADDLGELTISVKLK